MRFWPSHAILCKQSPTQQKEQSQEEGQKATRKHFSEKTRLSVSDPHPCPDLSQNHTWSLSGLPRGGWAPSPCGRGSPADKQHSRGRAASVCFPKGTMERLKYKELKGQAIKNTFGRNTRAIKKII